MSDVSTNQEVLVGHANARLNLHGTRVVGDGRPLAHVATELRTHVSARTLSSRDSALKMNRDCSTGSHVPTDARAAPPVSSNSVSRSWGNHRRGQDWIGPELGVPARTVAAILRRHQVPTCVSAIR